MKEKVFGDLEYLENVIIIDIFLIFWLGTELKFRKNFLSEV